MDVRPAPHLKIAQPFHIRQRRSGASRAIAQNATSQPWLESSSSVARKTSTSLRSGHIARSRRAGRTHAPPRSKQRATQSPSTFSQQCCPTSACRMNSTRWRGCPSRHRKMAFYASANSCTLRSKRFVSTEHVQLKLNFCVARTHLPAKPSWSTTSATAPRSAVKATRNALGLPDDFTGTVAGCNLPR